MINRGHLELATSPIGSDDIENIYWQFYWVFHTGFKRNCKIWKSLYGKFCHFNWRETWVFHVKRHYDSDTRIVPQPCVTQYVERLFDQYFKKIPDKHWFSFGFWANKRQLICAWDQSRSFSPEESVKNAKASHPMDRNSTWRYKSNKTSPAHHKEGMHYRNILLSQSLAFQPGG